MQCVNTVTVPQGLRHRLAETVLTITGPDGAPLADTDVVVEQTRHELGIGNIGFDFVAVANGEKSNADSLFGGARPELAQALTERFFDLFNVATLPFYWRSFEPEEGHPCTERLANAARWIRAHGADVKGHPLAWHTLAPQWLLGRDPEEVERVLRARITREATGFRGLVDTWDAINEVVIMPEFTAEDNAITPLARRLGRVGMVRLAFETARAANPDAFLLLNDFNMSEKYAHLIEDCLEAGVKIDAIGLQSHMHQGYWGEERTLEVLERFSRFGLPLHFTETTLVSGHLMPPEIVDLNDYQIPQWPSTPEGEERQADEIRRHYTTLASHPAVAAITYWGFTDDGAWLGAPVGFARADGSLKPSYAALHDLVKGQWWTPPTMVRTDAEGRLRLSGFRGTYRVTAADRSGEVTLDAAVDQAGTSVTLRK